MVFRKVLACVTGLVVTGFLAGGGCGSDNASSSAKDPGPGDTAGATESIGIGTRIGDYRAAPGGTGNGGNGDRVEADERGGAGIHIGGSGTVDTSFTLPLLPTSSFGTDPWIVASDTTVLVYTSAASGDVATVDGDYYMVLGSTAITCRDSLGGNSTVTGLHIESGVTLTLGLNQNWSGNTGQDTCVVDFNDDVLIEGTLTVAALDTGTLGAATIDNRRGVPATSADFGSLELMANGIVVTPTGAIDVSGGDAAALSNADGGHGGAISVISIWEDFYMRGRIDASGGNGDGMGNGGFAGMDGDLSSAGIWTEAASTDLVNTGTLMANGGDGAIGGDAANVTLQGEFNTYNAGQLYSNGGTGINGDAGHGQIIEFATKFNSVYTTGTVEANGGISLTNGNGGNGGGLHVYAARSAGSGDGLISGVMSMNGGGAGSDGTFHDGGNGGYIYIDVEGGDVRVLGTINLKGGNGDLTGGNGGNGGDVIGLVFEGTEYGTANVVPPGDIAWGARVYCNGGLGGNDGGDGGSFRFENRQNDDALYAKTSGIHLYGFGINTSGGDAPSGNGGSAGQVDLITRDSLTGNTPPGPIKVYTPIIANGGNGQNIGGAATVQILIRTGVFNGGVPDPSSSILLSGIEANGGEGGNGFTAGVGARVYINAVADIVYNGNINIRGGDAVTGDTPGGAGGELYIDSVGDAVINGSIDQTGGAATGTGTGGLGGYAEINADGQASMTGNYWAPGGNADPSVGTGGAGNYIWIDSGAGASVLSGSYDVTGGSGGTPGADGQFWVDTILIFP